MSTMQRVPQFFGFAMHCHPISISSCTACAFHAIVFTDFPHQDHRDMPTSFSCLRNLPVKRAGYLVPLIAFLVYANSLLNGFTLDDHSVIVNNPIFKGNFLSLFSVIDTIGEGQLLPLYRPFTYVTFYLEGKLHGFDPLLIRLVNVCLHALNSYLVFRLVRLLSDNESYMPVIAALLFAVHPINTEGVDFNAGGRNTMLACFFSLATYLVHDFCIKSNRIHASWGAAALFFLGLISKESALMIAPFIAWQEYGAYRQSAGETISRGIYRLTPYLLVSTLYLYLRWSTLSRYGIQTSIIPGFGTNLLESMYVIDPLGTRLIHNIYIIPRYLWSILCPVALVPRHSIPDDLNLLALPLFGTWAFIIAGIGWIISKQRSIITLFGIAWCFFFWLPVSGLFIIPIPLAERYLYAPSIGIWIITAYLVERLVRKPSLHKPTIIICALIAMLLAGLTIRRNTDWKSNLTLYTRFVDQFPESIHSLAGLGVAYYDENKPGYRRIAEALFEKALSIDPYAPKINTLLGNIKLDNGDFARALELYSRALETLPNDKEALLNKGITFEKIGNNKEALSAYRSFLTLPGRIDHIPGGRQHAEERVRALSR